MGSLISIQVYGKDCISNLIICFVDDRPVYGLVFLFKWRAGEKDVRPVLYLVLYDGWKACFFREAPPYRVWGNLETNIPIDMVAVTWCYGVCPCLRWNLSMTLLPLVSPS